MTPPEPRVVLSIVVPSHDRCEPLRRLLTSLARLPLPRDGRYEVITVDNNSSDDTRAVVEACAAASPHPLRYVFERRQGIAYARNAGIRSARGEIVACTDSDCLATPDWAATLFEEFTVD